MFRGQKLYPPIKCQFPLKYRFQSHFFKAKMSSYPLLPNYTHTYLHFSSVMLYSVLTVILETNRPA